MTGITEPQYELEARDTELAISLWNDKAKQFGAPPPLGEFDLGDFAAKSYRFLVCADVLFEDSSVFLEYGLAFAELLGLPHATLIMQIEVSEARVKLKRELEAGWFQWVEAPLPAVLTIQSGINKVRYATLKGIMAAKKKEMVTISRAALGVVSEPTQRLERIYVPHKAKKTEFLSGTPKEAAAKLVEKLKFEARVL